MEFFNLSRYMDIREPRLLPFAELRTLKPVAMTQDLSVVDEPANMEYARSLADRGAVLVPIRRQPPFARYTDRIGFPRRVILEMTSRCNFLCRMCPQRNLKRPRMDMPGSLYRRVVDELDDHGIEGLWIYHLGESLLHPEFRENIRHISNKKNLGVIWMSTNGQYFGEDNIKCVLASNLDYINYSMHAVTEATYRTVSEQGDFTTVRNNLRAFFRLKGAHRVPKKPFLHCQMIEQETTRHEIDAFLEAYHEPADIVSVNMLEYVNLPNNTYGLKQRDRKPLSSCLRVARNDCFILSNGGVTVCDAAYNDELTLGNVNSSKLADIWAGPARRNLLDLNRQGKMNEVEFCRRCTDYDI